MYVIFYEIPKGWKSKDLEVKESGTMVENNLFEFELSTREITVALNHHLTRYMVRREFYHLTYKIIMTLVIVF